MSEGAAHWNGDVTFQAGSNWSPGKGSTRPTIKFPSDGLQLGPGQSPGASLCAALRGEIEDLRAEINRRYEQYGRDRDAIVRAAQGRSEICGMSSSNQQEICNALSRAVGSLTGNAASAMNHLASRCSCSLPNAPPCEAGPIYRGGDFQTAQFLACLLLSQGIEEIEARIERERRQSLQWHYRWDIAPLEEYLRGLELRYQRCAGIDAKSTVPPPYVFPCTRACANWNLHGYSTCRACCTTNCGFRGCQSEVPTLP